MKRTVTKIVGFVVCVVVAAWSFTACHRSQPSWNAQILTPIVSTSLSINDIITSKYISSNPDSSVSLVYTDSLYNISLITIPDTVIKYDTVWPSFAPTYTFTPGSIMLPAKPTPTQYNLGGVELVKGILRTGWLVYVLRNPLNQPIDYQYTVYNISVNSNTLVIPKVEVLAKSTLKDSIFLGGAIIDFTGPMHNGYNTITTSIQVNLDSSASPLIMAPSDTLVAAQITFRQIVPNYAQGYFGTVTKSYGPTNVTFPVFNKIVGGSLALQKANVNLTLYNGFGVDARLTISKLTSNRNGDTIALGDIGLISTPININRATETGNPSAPVNPTITTYSLNPSNTNILPWLDNLPTSVGYALQITTDPLGNVAGFHDFAYYGYGINANINISIPLSLIANNLTLADTLALNFAGSGNATQHVKSGKLTIYATNGFPFSAGLQMYLLNSNNVISDSLFIPAQTIAAGNINPGNGKVISSQNSVLVISLDAAKTLELFNSKTAIMYARFNMGSLPSTYLNIYSYYQLGLKVTGNFDYQVN